jgi:SHS2 domain-containing protein
MDVVNSTLQNLINENVNAFADVFEIISKNINIVDKVQVGLTNKTLNQIMKPIIKKDDIKVFHCDCVEYKNNELCKVWSECIHSTSDEVRCAKKGKKINKIVEDEGIKNVVIFGCKSYIYYWTSKTDNIVTNIYGIGEEFSKNKVQIKKFSNCHTYEIIDKSKLSKNELKNNLILKYYYNLNDETIIYSFEKVYKEIIAKRQKESEVFGMFRDCDCDSECDCDIECDYEIQRECDSDFESDSESDYE